MAIPTPSRRQFLIAAGATLSGIAVSSSGLANFAPYYAHRLSRNPLPGNADPFTLGVASGSPTSNGFILWTRLAPDPLSRDAATPGGIALQDHDGGIALDYEIATDPLMRHVLRQGVALAESQHGFSVHLPVEGLAADRPYWYRFHLGPFASAIGRAMTLPRAGRPATQVKLGFTSCANFERGYFSGYRHLAAEQPDLVLMLGDYIYEQVERSRPVLRRHSDSEVPTTLDGYRRRYAQYRLDPDLQALHATAPTMITWDDHEVENDYAGDWSEKFTPPAQFAQQRQAAYRAFYDHMPVRNRPTATGLDIYDSVTIGDLARISLLDGRQYRARGACYAAPSQGGGHQVDSVSCPELLDPSRSMLGWDQERWLGGNLTTSPARWNIVAQNVIMAELDSRDADGKVTAWTDAWDGYPMARRRLLEQLDRARNPVVFSGDIHSFWSNDLVQDNRTIASEFVTSSITSDGPPQAHLQSMMDAHPHVHFAESRQRGYTLVEIAGGRLTSHFRTIDNVTDPKAGLSTLRRFVIEDGRVGAVAA